VTFRLAASDEPIQAHKELEPVGPVRVLAYNSPSMLFWRKHSEVRIPVRAITAPTAAVASTSDAVP
jgi:hypothetical protein